MIEYPQLLSLNDDYIKSKVESFLAEDMPRGDITSDGIDSGPNQIRAIVQAEENLVLAGCNTLKFFFDDCKIDCFYSDGNAVSNGSLIAAITGEANNILKKERAFLNLIQRLSGIASITMQYAEIAGPYGIKILDTRKTTPGLRLFEKYAVCRGGGYNHRLDLSSGILIKDNHIEAAGGITNAVKAIKSKNYGLPVELEVENEDQIAEGMDAAVDGFLLDNMDREQTISAVRLIRGYPIGHDIFIESSGGINLSNLKNYIDTGINAISVGALTHSIKAANIHMEFENIV